MMRRLLFLLPALLLTGCAGRYAPAMLSADSSVAPAPSFADQVAALPGPQRLALYLHYYQGYTTGEIADMLGENPSTVRSRLVQARKKLKLKMEEEGYGQT